MNARLLVAALLGGVLLTSCWDDPESPVNIPPNLRREDVLGCWSWSQDGYCEMECYDSSGASFYQTTSKSSGRIYESIGRFSLHGYSVDETIHDRSNTSSLGSELEIQVSVNYRRLGKSLWVLGDNFKLSTEYKPVRLDSTLPCGEPFTLFPKPAGWTLF